MFVCVHVGVCGCMYVGVCKCVYVCVWAFIERIFRNLCKEVDETTCENPIGPRSEKKSTLWEIRFPAGDDSQLQLVVICLCCSRQFSSQRVQSVQPFCLPCHA